jgi:hypothetical protein
LLPGESVEAEPPGVAHAKREDFVETRYGAVERVGRRRDVAHARRRIDVDSKNLAEKSSDVLRIVGGIVGGPTVANPYVEIVVWTECQHAAVMVRVHWMWNRQQDFFSRIGDIRIGRCLVFSDDKRAVSGARVIHKEPGVDGVLRMERETEESAFSASEDFRADVEKNRRRRTARLQQANRSGLFDDEQAVRTIAGVADEDGARETGNDRLELNGRGYFRSKTQNDCCDNLTAQPPSRHPETPAGRRCRSRAAVVYCALTVNISVLLVSPAVITATS